MSLQAEGGTEKVCSCVVRTRGDSRVVATAVPRRRSTGAVGLERWLNGRIFFGEHTPWAWTQSRRQIQAGACHGSHGFERVPVQQTGGSLDKGHVPLQGQQGSCMDKHKGNGRVAKASQGCSPPPPPPPLPPFPRQREPWLARFHQGLAFVRRNGGIQQHGRIAVRTMPKRAKSIGGLLLTVAH